MKKQKYFVAYTPEEAALVIQSLNGCGTPCSGKTGIPAGVDELLLKVMCAPVKKI